MFVQSWKSRGRLPAPEGMIKRAKSGCRPRRCQLECLLLRSADVEAPIPLKRGSENDGHAFVEDAHFLRETLLRGDLPEPARRFVQFLERETKRTVMHRHQPA